MNKQPKKILKLLSMREEKSNFMYLSRKTSTEVIKTSVLLHIEARAMPLTFMQNIFAKIKAKNGKIRAPNKQI